MGLLGFLGFVLQCFDVLAWPLLALLYPLYSSIKAIETNSITDTHKLNTYWVVFSLILLFEHAFMKLLEWFSLWPYIRLLIVFSLVMPHFDGAFYVYKHLICPCLSIDPQIVFSLLNKRKDNLVREKFLSDVERYVKENGSEGLEKLIACKSTKTNPDVKEFNAVSFMDNEAVSETEPNFIVNEKTIKVAADTENLKTLPPKKDLKEWTTFSPVPTQTDATYNVSHSGNKHNATGEALKKKNVAEPKLAQTENCTVAAMEFAEKPVDPESPKNVQTENVAEPKLAQTENRTVAAMEVADKPVDPESPKNVQTEWTCALCQVTVTCERTLNSHMQGKKHKAASEALKPRNPKNSPASTAKTSDQPNKEPGKSISSSGSKQKVKLNENVQAQKNSSPISKKLNKSKEKLADFVSSNGQKGKIAVHVDKVQSRQPKPSEVARLKHSPRWCAICSIPCANKIAMEAHLNGKKHKENVQALEYNIEYSSGLCGDQWPTQVADVSWSADAPAAIPAVPAAGWTEPGAAQEGWDAAPAPAPAVGAPVVKGGAPVVASGWDM